LIEIDIHNVFSKARGLSEHPAIMKCLEAYVPGYKYTLNFKRGRWDGKINLFNGEEFLTGLLPVVVDALTHHKVPFTLHECRGIVTPVLQPSRVPLRPYQQEAVNTSLMNTQFGTWWPRGVIQVATGGGKTEMAADLIAKTNVPTMFLVHRKDLQTQAIERFQKYNLNVGGLDTIATNTVTVTTIQSLMSWNMNFKKFYTNSDGEEIERSDKWLAKKNKKQSDSAKAIQLSLLAIQQVFIDEAHLIASTADKVGLFGSALQLMPNAYMRWGLTATPFMREQLHDWMLEGGTGGILVQITNRELIDAGFLTECVVDMFLTGKQPDIPKTWPECYDYGVVTSRIRNDKIVQCFNSYPGPTLVLVSKLSHGELLSKRLGIPFLSGQSTAPERRQAIEDLKNKVLPGVIASTIWDEGVDLQINAIILAGAGKSEIKNLQRLGRGLRTASGKIELRLVDFIDQSPAILHKHSQERKKFWENQGFKINILKC
jgi:superfamily II DNA or RNA helicase